MIKDDTIKRGIIWTVPTVDKGKILKPEPDWSLAIILAIGTSSIQARSVAAISSYPPPAVDWDATIYWKWRDDDTDEYIGAWTGADWSPKCFPPNMTSSIGAGSYHEYFINLEVISSSTSSIGARSVGTIYKVDQGIIWVAWSKIGEFDFSIDRSNEAGERPMLWGGTGFHIQKLGDKVIVYGSGGVSAMKPKDVAWGLHDITDIGVINKGAVCGDDTVHFFVNSKYQLYQLSDKLERLDYSEYISLMSGTIVLSYDPEKRLVYICNNTYGYVYGVDNKSFGAGPANVTGIGHRTGDLYVTSKNAITVPNFNIITDTYDFGTRKPKTITEIEIGTDVASAIEMSVDYRINYQGVFNNIGWFFVNPNGRAYPTCYGHEFRFRFRLSEYMDFGLDYIKVKGHIHGFSYLDSFGRWGEK